MDGMEVLESWEMRGNILGSVWNIIAFCLILLGLGCIWTRKGHEGKGMETLETSSCLYVM